MIKYTFPCRSRHPKRNINYTQSVFTFTLVVSEHTQLDPNGYTNMPQVVLKTRYMTDFLDGTIINVAH
jgi:hypothetical protein